MRPHGVGVSVNRHSPRAQAVCDRCGRWWNRYKLQFQTEWYGARVQNTNFLVCDPCLDELQEQLRVIVLPADPTPIGNPRPERYTVDNNPISPLGISVGNLSQAAGLNSAFDSNANKPMFLSACRYLSVNGALANSVGRNWNGLSPNNQGIIAGSFSAWAPNNAKFFGGGVQAYAFQGSNDNSTWTSIITGTTVGTVGETLTVTLASAAVYYLYHRLAFTGDGINSVSVAQLQINSLSAP